MKTYRVVVLCPAELDSPSWEELFPQTYQDAKWTCVVVHDRKELCTQGNMPYHCLVEILGQESGFSDRQEEADPLTVQVQLQEVAGNTSGYYVFNLLTRQMRLFHEEGSEPELVKLICIMTVDNVRRQERPLKEARKPRISTN